MNIADLRNRVTFYTATTSSDSIGNQIKTLTKYATRWASVSFSSGGEETEGGAEKATESIRITVRYDSKTKKITPVGFSAEFGDRTWDIKSVQNDKMRNQTVTITAERSY